MSLPMIGMCEGVLLPLREFLNIVNEINSLFPILEKVISSVSLCESKINFVRYSKAKAC